VADYPECARKAPPHPPKSRTLGKQPVRRCETKWPGCHCCRNPGDGKSMTPWAGWLQSPPPRSSISLLISVCDGRRLALAPTALGIGGACLLSSRSSLFMTEKLSQTDVWHFSSQDSRRSSATCYSRNDPSSATQSWATVSRPTFSVSTRLVTRNHCSVRSTVHA